MLTVFAMNQVIKECHRSKYHHHITVPSNILIGMARMPLGTLGIAFPNSNMFISRNRLNRLMSHKLKYTNQTILYVFDIYIKRFLIEREIDISVILLHIFYTEFVLTVF